MELQTTNDEQEWPLKLAAQVVDQVDSVKQKTTKPAELAAKGVVAMMALLTLVPAIIVLLFILAGRVMEKVPGDIHWMYLIVGGILYVPGVLFLLKAGRR